MLVMKKLKLWFHLLRLEEAKKLVQHYQIQSKPVFVNIRDTDTNSHRIVLINHLNQCLLSLSSLGNAVKQQH